MFVFRPWSSIIFVLVVFVSTAASFASVVVVVLLGALFATQICNSLCGSFLPFLLCLSTKDSCFVRLGRCCCSPWSSVCHTNMQHPLWIISSVGVMGVHTREGHSLWMWITVTMFDPFICPEDPIFCMVVLNLDLMRSCIGFKCFLCLQSLLHSSCLL